MELETSLPSLERDLDLAKVKAAEILQARQADIDFTHQLIVQTRQALQKVSEGLPRIETISETPSEKPPKVASSDPTSPSGETSFSEQVRQKAKPILEKATEPLRKDELLKQLRAVGLSVDTPQQIDLMRKALTRRDSGVILVKRRGFWLKDRDVPA